MDWNCNNLFSHRLSYRQGSIFFVHTKEIGRQLSSLLHKYTTKYREYFDSDISENLIYFSEGTLDCLITCHRLSQGIDIVGLKQVFIIASDRAKLETIQRIGRCLRKNPDDPEKKAKIFDLIDKSYQADMLRNKWLINLSKVRKS